MARVGVSFISTDQACANAESEIPDFNFDGVRAANEAQWEELLGRFSVDTKGVSEETVELLYSSVRALCLYLEVIYIRPSFIDRISPRLIVCDKFVFLLFGNGY